MKKSFVAIILLGMVSLAVTAEVKLPNSAEEVTVAKDVTIEHDIYREDFEAMAGEWYCYMYVDGVKRLFPDYTYILDADGNWDRRDLITDSTKRMGEFSILAGQMVLVPAPKEGEEKRGITVAAASKNGFVISPGGNHEVFLRFERRTDEIANISADKLVKSWTIYQKIGEESRKAPFKLIFYAYGKCELSQGKGDVNKITGTYVVKEGKVHLKWEKISEYKYFNDAVFFLDDDKLILNRQDVYIFGERD